jgi:hypothetical protein
VAVITAVTTEEVLTARHKEPSVRTLRTRQLEHDAAAVADAVDTTGAALIEVTAEEGPTARYLTGLRNALLRLGFTHILLQKRRGQDTIAAWRERPEDTERLEKRRQHGARLGQMAKQRAAQGRGRPRRRAS